MIKTLAQAKRDFKVDVEFKVITHNLKQERVGAVGKITKTFTNKFEYLDSLTGKVFTFWWGNTKINEYKGNILTVKNYVNNENINFEFEIIKK